MCLQMEEEDSKSSKTKRESGEGGMPRPTHPQWCSPKRYTSSTSLLAGMPPFFAGLVKIFNSLVDMPPTLLTGSPHISTHAVIEMSRGNHAAFPEKRKGHRVWSLNLCFCLTSPCSFGSCISNSQRTKVALYSRLLNLLCQELYFHLGLGGWVCFEPKQGSWKQA